MKKKIVSDILWFILPMMVVIFFLRSGVAQENRAAGQLLRNPSESISGENGLEDVSRVTADIPDTVSEGGHLAERNGEVPPPTDKKIFLGTKAEGETQGKVLQEGKPKESQEIYTLLWMFGILTVIMFVVFCLLRKFRQDGSQVLSREVFEILGKTHLGFHQQVYLLRCGKTIFLVAISAQGVERIGEIRDLAEVELLTQMCHGNSRGLELFQILRRFQENTSVEGGTSAGSGVPGAPRGKLNGAKAFCSEEKSSVEGPPAGNFSSEKQKMSFDEIYHQVLNRHGGMQ
ncbi:MAG: flagellar biosynthetic protein FliO [Planctomycetia bacterium]|nr:flagellar biosynthetic protein FliO [Planctomycetia bacterium]